MAEVRKHVPLTISRPGVEELLTITFVANVTDYLWKIPYRYPFADIENLSALKTAGFFRGKAFPVSSELNGSASADVETDLGFELPNTEKLILLVKVLVATATSAVTITITGSTEFGIDDVSYEIPIAAAAGTVYEIDLYNFGLYIDGGEVNITIDDATTVGNNAKIAVALVARMG